MYPVLLLFDISGGELLVILVIAFIVFGPSKLPELARKIGRGMNEIRRASDEIKREINKETRKFEQDFTKDVTLGKDFEKTTEDINKGLHDVTSSIDKEKKTGPKTSGAKLADETSENKEPGKEAQ